MKARLFSTICFLFAVFYVTAQNNLERTWRQDTEKIRIISYNILDGFDYLKDTDRMNRFSEWIKEKDPAVLALQELVGFKEADLKKLAESYGHPYVAVVKEGGYPVGITSKKPIKVINKFVDGYWHGVLHVQTYDMDFIVIHLSPSDKYFRLEEARKISAYIRENCPETALVMGDFNSHSPFDADELETHTDRIRQMALEEAKKYPEESTRNFTPDYFTQATFIATPLTDVCRLFVKPDKRTTFPTRILTDISKRDDLHTLSGERIDYIFVSPALVKKCVDGFIWNSEDTDYLSDHYPIGIDMLLELKK